MRTQLLANIRTNLRFFRRNRLFLVALLFFIITSSLSFLPNMFLSGSADRFDTVVSIISSLGTFGYLLSGTMILILVSYHLRGRSLKMVVTKPCTPALWAGAGMLTAGLVAFVFYLVVALVCSGLMLAWEIPFQWGIFYVCAYRFLVCLIVISYLGFLAVVMHPVAAIFFLLVVNDDLLYYFILMLESKAQSAGEGAAATLSGFGALLIKSIYGVLPSFSPVSKKAGAVFSSLRVMPGEWLSLVYVCGYALVAVSFFYLLTIYVLGKKNP
ncbi:MAG: hypothetical protein KAR83_01000 [Thermodesulfovibrionales bacterium]|nr:hypothetical protein [Thermodesulfovibrionales bacterium]